ncbi:hypothetical protein AVEN_120819-1 [Araneus ventricosus]|uniref:Uncharacterized protein n=1 Tax=Araneus ventricosus TaxID=182803 RepID=A0A4Y2FCQ9_ARAVE|nr:hypothetical protein AVEN_120819-1 [Araneus ventricosus]
MGQNLDESQAPHRKNPWFESNLTEDLFVPHSSPVFPGKKRCFYCRKIPSDHLVFVSETRLLSFLFPLPTESILIRGKGYEPISWSVPLILPDNQKDLDHPTLDLSGILNDSDRYDSSSIEAGVLVAHHRPTARPLPKEVRTIPGGRTQSPTITIPTGEASSCLLISQQLIFVYSRCPSVEGILPDK